MVVRVIPKNEYFKLSFHWPASLDHPEHRAAAVHIVPFGKFYRIGGAPPETFPNIKYDAPEEVGGNRKCFDSPIRK